MKLTRKQHLIAAALVAALAITSAHAQKFEADVPVSITTPDSVTTRIGTLKFFDGLPDAETTQKVYGNLDFGRGVEAFLADRRQTSVSCSRWNVINPVI